MISWIRAATHRDHYTQHADESEHGNHQENFIRNDGLYPSASKVGALYQDSDYHQKRQQSNEDDYHVNVVGDDAGITTFT